MKNTATLVLLAFTIAFSGFLVGFYLGRIGSDSRIAFSTNTPSSTQSSVPTSSENATNNPAKINLNTASLEQLKQVPGISATLAQQILNYRSIVGSFQNLWELMEVDGITESKYYAIVNYFTL